MRTSLESCICFLVKMPRVYNVGCIKTPLMILSSSCVVDRVFRMQVSRRTNRMHCVAEEQTKVLHNDLSTINKEGTWEKSHCTLAADSLARSWHQELGYQLLPMSHVFLISSLLSEPRNRQHLLKMSGESAHIDLSTNTVSHCRSALTPCNKARDELTGTSKPVLLAREAENKVCVIHRRF